MDSCTTLSLSCQCAYNELSPVFAPFALAKNLQYIPRIYCVRAFGSKMEVLNEKEGPYIIVVRIVPDPAIF